MDITILSNLQAQGLPRVLPSVGISSHTTTSLKQFTYIYVRAVPAAYGSSRLGIQSELQLQVYTTATATQDPSHICNLYRSFQQC